jgi:hypothetical protein
MPLGFTVAHGHSGLLGQGPASWPMVAAFGMAQAMGSWPERVQRAWHAITMQCVSSTRGVA